MATTDLRSNAGSYPIGGAFKKKIDVDFSTYNGGDGDKFTLMDLKEGMMVSAIVKPTTAEGGAATIELQTTETTPQVLITGGDINATAALGGTEFWLILEDCELEIETNTAATDTAVLEVHVAVVR